MLEGLTTPAVLTGGIGEGLRARQQQSPRHVHGADRNMGDAGRLVAQEMFQLRSPGVLEAIP
jgi:hypothetical protein